MYHQISQKAVFFIENVTQKMPWQLGASAYEIWIFEIIMQQTRLEQGFPYYKRFLERFKDIETLAKSDIDSVYEVWKGLGYYSRARNIHETAKIVLNNHNGIFPDTYDEIIKLKGIGSYTAAAISSFAFQKDIAVLDGNVYRLLSRLTASSIDMFSNAGKKYYENLAQQFMLPHQGALINQAFMHIGSNICKPKNPDCLNCPFNNECKAFQTESIENFPVPKKRNPLKPRFFFCVFFIYQNKIALYKRTQKDIWEGMYQGAVIENELFDLNEFKRQFNEFNFDSISFEDDWQIQKLSHIKAHFKFAIVKLNQKPKKMNSFHKISEIEKMAFPKIISNYLNQQMNIIIY